MKLVVEGTTHDVSPSRAKELDVVDATPSGAGTSFVVRHEGRLQAGHLCRTAEGWRLWLGGRLVDVERPTTAVGAGGGSAGGGLGPVTAPYACRLLAVHVKVGRKVNEGTPLFRIESMKMEHEVTASCDGVVSEIRANEGTALSRGDVILVVAEEQKEEKKTEAKKAPPAGANPLINAIHGLLVAKKVIAPDKVLTLDMRLNEDVGIDSLAMVRLVGTVREQFGIHITARDMTKENFATIGTLVAYLQRKMGQG